MPSPPDDPTPAPALQRGFGRTLCIPEPPELLVGLAPPRRPTRPHVGSASSAISRSHPDAFRPAQRSAHQAALPCATGRVHVRVAPRRCYKALGDVESFTARNGSRNGCDIPDFSFFFTHRNVARRAMRAGQTGSVASRAATPAEHLRRVRSLQRRPAGRWGHVHCRRSGHRHRSAGTLKKKWNTHN